MARKYKNKKRHKGDITEETLLILMVRKTVVERLDKARTQVTR
jgi:hypothetical protein